MEPLAKIIGMANGGLFYGLGYLPGRFTVPRKRPKNPEQVPSSRTKATLLEVDHRETSHLGILRERGLKRSSRDLLYICMWGMGSPGINNIAPLYLVWL